MIISQITAPIKLGKLTYPGVGFSPLSVTYARTVARQTALEIANTGADRATSWSCWVRFSNLIPNVQRVFSVSNDDTLINQYALYLISGDNQSSINNGKLRFTSFTTNTAIIEAQTSQQVLRNRYYHVVVTYTGSELTSGLKIYINGVDDTVALTPTGTYTGGRNDGSLRFKIGYESDLSDWGGDIRDLAIWNKALSGTEVTELFNAGLPRANSAASFYGNIISDWPCYTDLNSIQNSAYNLSSTSASGISHDRFPFSLVDKPLSFKRATIGDTRYVAFGGVLRKDANTVSWYGRSGTSHVAGAKIIRIDFDLTTQTAAAPVDVIVDGTYSMSGVSCGIDSNGHIHVFTTRYNSGTDTFIDTGVYTSTDGGATFGAMQPYPTTRARYEFYGKMVEGFSAGEYFVPFYEHTGGTIWTISVFKITGFDFANPTKIQVYNGADSLSETAIWNLGNNTLIGLIRRFSSTYGIYQTVSTDGGTTWSVPALTNLAPQSALGANCELITSPTGKLSVMIMDRSDDYARISKENSIATILASPTAWNTSRNVFRSYATDSLNILGYPNMIRLEDGNCLCTISAEFSASRADLYFAIGSL